MLHGILTRSNQTWQECGAFLGGILGPPPPQVLRGQMFQNGIGVYKRLLSLVAKDSLEDPSGHRGVFRSSTGAL